jgi:CubicO group peptidase (beta-lactamase class C family)
VASFNRHTGIARALAFGLGSCVLTPAASAQISGIEVPELNDVDNAMINFMNANGIRGAVLGIMRNGCIIYQRGFGWHDEAETVAMPENALVRIASCTKPITAAAIQDLVDDGVIDTGDFIFDLGQPGGGGIVPCGPFGGLGDSRLEDVTVQHCLSHQGGWDRDVTPDLTRRECQIADEMGIESPPGRMNTMNWILGQGLEFTPGDDAKYANAGYLALGMAVESVSGMNHIDYIRSHILTPNMWVPWTDIRVGRTFPENQPSREAYYNSSENRAQCVFPRGIFNACGVNREPEAYGGYDHEARVGQGAMVVSAATMLRFLDTYRVQTFSDDIGARLNGTYVPGAHDGSLPGLNTLMRQRSDGIHYFVFFNNDSTGDHYGWSFDAILNPILSAVTDWPADCVDGFWVHPTAASTGTYGSYNRPFADMDQALPNLGHGSRVNFWPGESDWNGTITTKLMLRAPLGTVRIGQP